jgi:hypothetical protein
MSQSVSRSSIKVSDAQPLSPADRLKHLNLENIHPEHKQLLEGDGRHIYYSERRMRQQLIEWLESGPPPLSEYRLSFGKHRGRLLEEVPDLYMVKYLVPRCKSRCGTGECPIVGVALEDFLKRHPEIKSQAGLARTKPLEEGILKPQVAKKRGRPPGKVVKKSPVQLPVIDRGVDELSKRIQGPP